jgi:putative ABC transport system permease protein
MGANVFVGRLDVEGQSEEARETNPMIPMELGNAEYFRVFDIPIRRGRGFVDADREDAEPVAVVSEAVARRFWPNENPVGRRIRFWSADTTAWRTVVGVAGDIRFRSLRDTTPSVYLPWRQTYWQGTFAVRTSMELAAILPAVRREIRAVDPQLTLWQAQTMGERLAEPLAQPRMSALLLSSFSLVALLLAAIGLYGVMASVVREQTRELGIRMALGATPHAVRRSVLARALGMTGVGAVVGLAGALLISRLLARLLFEVSPTDPVTLATVCGLLAVVAFCAAYIPARRATRIDPAESLRVE